MKRGNPRREGGKKGGRDEREREGRTGGRARGRDIWKVGMGCDSNIIMKWVHMAWNGCLIGKCCYKAS